MLAKGAVILIRQNAIGNPRAARVRVEYIHQREGSQRIEIRGFEVCKDGMVRIYFGRRLSEWHAYLLPDDYELIESAAAEGGA